MKLKKILVLFTLFIIGYSLSAQKLWTFEACLTYAYENNIQIKQQKINSDIKDLDLQQSKFSLLPSVNGSASHAYNYGRTIDMYTNDFASSKVQSNNFYLSSGVTLFNGFQLLNTIKQNQIDKEAAAYDLEKIKNDIALTIATAYLQVLFNYEYLEIRQNQYNISTLQTERTKILVEAGTVSKAGLYSIEAQAAADELQLVNAQNQLALSYLTLAQLLDLPNTEGFLIERPQIDISGLSLPAQTMDYVYNTAIIKMPEVKSAELKLKSAEKGLSIAKSSMSPNLSLRGSLGTGYSGASKEVTDVVFANYIPIGLTQSQEIVYGPSFNYITQIKPFKEQLNDNLNQSISLNLTLPIFNGLQSRTAIKKSQLMIENASYNLQNTKNQLNKTIQQAYADAMSAYNKYEASKKSVKAFEESFQYMEQRFNLGMLNSIDYNDSKTKLINAQSELLQSKYEFVFRVKILDFYQGKPISIQ